MGSHEIMTNLACPLFSYFGVLVVQCLCSIIRANEEFIELNEVKVSKRSKS